MVSSFQAKTDGSTLTKVKCALVTRGVFTSCFNPPNMNHSPQQPDKLSKQLLIQQLRGRIRQVETVGRNDDGTVVSSGCDDLDAILPNGGYHRGTIIEWLADRGSCADYLSLLVARNAACNGGAIVIVDHQEKFFPPAARSIGINLGNLIVLRGNSKRDRFYRSDSKAASHNPSGQSSLSSFHPGDEDFLWAIDQSLRCPAVAAVWGPLPEFKTTLSAERWLRRFQLSAESSGCLGLFTRNLRTQNRSRHLSRKLRSGSETSSQPDISWAEVQWHLRPQHSMTENTRAVRAILARCRGGIAGRAVDLEINMVTGNVQRARSEHATKHSRTSCPLPVAAQLARSKAGRRAARA